ncbi:MAG: CHAP domain-containing protein [Campylobacterales bacterium]
MICFFMLLTGCSTKSNYTPSSITPKPEPKPKETHKKPQSPQAHPLRDVIKPYFGTRKGGDCSGFVLEVSKDLGYNYFDTDELLKHYTNSRRSKAMHNYYKRKGRVFYDKTPKVGDLVFFHNTVGYSKDPSNITHIGIVYRVMSDGTVEFANLLSGIVKLSYINLQTRAHYKNNKVINSFLKKCPRGSRKHRCLAYDLFAGYGARR